MDFKTASANLKAQFQRLSKVRSGTAQRHIESIKRIALDESKWTSTFLKEAIPIRIKPSVVENINNKNPFTIENVSFFESLESVSGEDNGDFDASFTVDEFDI